MHARDELSPGSTNARVATGTRMRSRNGEHIPNQTKREAGPAVGQSRQRPFHHLAVLDVIVFRRLEFYQ
jgi:hypothetical protein